LTEVRAGLLGARRLLHDPGGQGMISHAEAAVMKGYAEKAIELDDDLAEAHASLAAAKQEQWDMRGAEMELKRASSSSPAIRPRSIVLHPAELSWKVRRGLRAREEGSQARPVFELHKPGVGIALFMLGRYGEAVDTFEKLMDMDPNFASGYYFGAWAHYLAGDPDTAIKLAEKAIEKAGAQYFYPKMTLANLYARSGRGSSPQGCSTRCD